MLLFWIYTTNYAQNPINVTQQTIRIPAFEEETLYFGFAEGDQIQFSYSEEKNKKLSQIEIKAYPNTTKHTEKKIKNIQNLNITAEQTGVYVFTFKNNALSARNAQIKIQRIPKNTATTNFNTVIKWETKVDTTYKTYSKKELVRQDTLYRNAMRDVLVNSVLHEEVLLDKVQALRAANNSNGSKISLPFKTPELIRTATRSQKIVSLLYWVGVGQEGLNTWKQNVKNIRYIKNSPTQEFVTPLGAYAMGTLNTLKTTRIGTKITFGLATTQQADLFLNAKPYKTLNQQNAVVGFKIINQENTFSKNYAVILDNTTTNAVVDTYVKVSALIQTDYFESRPYTEMILEPVYRDVTISEPNVRSYKVPVISSLN